MVNNLPAVAGDMSSCRRQAWEDPLKKEMATHFSILAWEISQTEEPGRLQSKELQRVRHDLATQHASTKKERLVQVMFVGKERMSYQETVTTVAEKYSKHVCAVTSVVSKSVRPYGLQPTRLLCP